MSKLTCKIILKNSQHLVPYRRLAVEFYRVHLTGCEQVGQVDRNVFAGQCHRVEMQKEVADLLIVPEALIEELHHLLDLFGVSDWVPLMVQLLKDLSDLVQVQDSHDCCE